MIIHAYPQSTPLLMLITTTVAAAITGWADCTDQAYSRNRSGERAHRQLLRNACL